MAGTSDDDISSCLIGDVIKVYVGPKSKRYAVHRALLTQYRWFRKRIFYDGIDPLSRDSISLFREDPKVFELLISWLYRKKLNAISTTDEDVAMQEAELYIDLYLRACVWGISEMQNAVMDRLRARQTCEVGYFPPYLIKKIYEKIEPESPLRSYIVDSFIHKGINWDDDGQVLDPTSNHILTRKRALKKQLDAGNHDFVLECYEALFQLCAKSKIRDPDKRTGCVYHEHEQGERCRL